MIDWPTVGVAVGITLAILCIVRLLAGLVLAWLDHVEMKGLD